MKKMMVMHRFVWIAAAAATLSAVLPLLASATLTPQPNLLRRTNSQSANNKNHLCQSQSFASRGGGGDATGTTAAKKKKPMKKTPFGLPSVVSNSLYRPTDVVVTILFGVLANMLTGTARTVYWSLVVLHALVMVATDYDGQGSWLKNNAGMNVGIPLWIMFLLDGVATIGDIVFPSILDGFDERTTFVSRYLFGYYSLPVLAFLDFGDWKNKKV